MSGAPPGASPTEMEALGVKVWGPVTQRRRDELRYGSNGSKSIDLKALIWHDHENATGGGYLDLRKLAGEGAPPRTSNGHSDGDVVACYDYHDADKNVVYQVIRWRGKKFSQHAIRAGARARGMEGVERVPYHLPELLASRIGDARVYITEGEKDANALADQLLIATTNPGGAGKWQVSFGEYLRGRKVVILPDNDEAGDNHALDVAKKLTGLASEIRIVRLDGLPAKGDVSDWLAAGGTAEELDQIADAVAPLTASAESTEKTAGINLADFLSIQAWATRDLPEPDRLLGDLITTDSRAFFIGVTGLGKTMFGFALALGMASGTGFLHWRSARPARVLYIDGEMSSALVKARSISELNRALVKTGRLTIYACDFSEQTAAICPGLGEMESLNTPDGQQFVINLIEKIGGVDVVIFDNVMSLLKGDQREEIPWSDTLPLIAALSSKRIGQVWFDHTGHDKTRQYGSSTKAWRFDAVGIMTPLPDDQPGHKELAFQLSFDPPGKARRRTPDNWQDFERCVIRLKDDAWTADTLRDDQMPGAPSAKETKLKDGPALLLRDMRDLIAVHGEMKSPGIAYALVRCITREHLRAKLLERGWFAADMLFVDAESKTKLHRKAYQAEWNALNALKRRGLCSFTNDLVWTL